jgi:LL-diaminopimelate aminotransferase
MFLNYPNNPTAAVADARFFEKVVAFAEKNNIMVCHDYAYSEMTFDGYRAPSFLETPGAMKVGIEFHSLSKTYNMTGWRIGWAAGNAEIVGGLGQIKSNIDSGIFEAIQIAGMAAMENDAEWLAQMSALYTERRDILVQGLQQLGIKAVSPKATFYIWAEVPEKYTSASFVAHLLEKAGIVTTPGNGFGDPGEGYFRMALTVSKERLTEALARLKQVGY